jgi:hypothetical protein
METVKYQPSSISAFSNQGISNSLGLNENFSFDSINKLIKELIKLNKEGLVNENQMQKIISLACTTLIEREVEQRISKSLNKSIYHIFKL